MSCCATRLVGSDGSPRTLLPGRLLQRALVHEARLSEFLVQLEMHAVLILEHCRDQSRRVANDPDLRVT
jgi:hypothetical protein